MKTRWKSLATIAVALPVSCLAWRIASAPAPDDATADARAAGKFSQRTTARAPSAATVNLVDATDSDPLLALALTDAAAARALAARTGPQAVVTVVVALAGNDLAATEAWARTLKEPLHDAAFSALATEVARFDPAMAFRLARQLDEFEPRQQMMALALAQLAATDPQGAWDALQKAAIPSERVALERVVLAAVAEHDPATVAEWIAREGTPPELAQSLTSATAQRWVQQEPEAAAAWIAALPGGESRQQATEALMQVWASRDPAAARAWLDGVPAGAARDEMAVALGTTLAVTDRGSAQALVTTIGSEALRSRLLARLECQPPPAAIDHRHAAGEACGCRSE